MTPRASLTIAQADALLRYERSIRRDQPQAVSCAAALLSLWDRPWSSAALRYACHALHRTLALGIDVLEQPLQVLSR